MLQINADRLLGDLQDLSLIGATPDGGVNRPALSQADLETRAWLKDRAKAAGLPCAQDGAGNLIVRLEGDNPKAKTVLAGSHLDSVPHGGRFDGPLGVLAALEALRTMQESGKRLALNLECVSFTDEEGTWLGLLGSRAFCGQLSKETLSQVRGGPSSFDDALALLGLNCDSVLAARCAPSRYAAFVEVHIEQGTRLEEAGLELGVVTEIVGIRWQWLRFLGEAGHAGTLPIAQRRDALWGAAAFVERARHLASQAYHPGVVNCGQIGALPGAFNIVPSEVRLALEVRHGSADLLDAMQQEMFKLARDCAKEHGLELAIEPVSAIAPAPMDAHVVDAIEAAAKALNLSHTRLMSFAGHDTQSLSAIMPSAMFFVPSVGGVSHNPKEFTHDEHIVNAANVMLHTLIALAGGADG